MENQIFRDVNTFLDINGPVLSFTTHPTGVTGIGTTAGTTGGGTVELTGIATVSFIDGSAVNLGSISYQWYEQGVGKVSNGTYITGAATTTLTLSNLITPDDNQRKFYLQADYIPNPQSGIGYSSGNATNEPLNSGIGTVTVTPMIEIIAQPSNYQVSTNSNRTFTVDAGLTDNTYTDDLQYEWMLNGEVVTDGTVTTTTTTTTTQSGTIEKTYTSPATLSIPSSSTNIALTLAGAQGGNGGSDAGGPGGRGAQGRAGRFTMPDGAKELNIYIGRRGNAGSSGGHSAGGAGGDNGHPENTGDGGNGGGAGQNGWSGGGGGGGAASFIQNYGSTILVSAGGGGGGGGSLNRGGDSGYSRNPGVGLGYGQGHVSELRNVGGAGQTKNGDGGGGGGGGGGTGSPAGGSSGQDNSVGGRAGGGGASAKNDEQVTKQGDGWLVEGDGYCDIKFTGNTSTPTTVTRNTVVSGAKTRSFTLKSNVVGLQTAQCRISSATASNSPLLTNEVNFVVLDRSEDSIVNIEEIGITDTANLSTINLGNGDYTFNLGVQDGGSTSAEYYVLYSPDNDIEIEMDLYGGKGEDRVSGSVGGEGGYSRIQFTLEQNVEYVIAGLTKDMQAPFLYRKGVLMAVVGGGGAGGPHGDGREGGLGGGVNVSGGDGTGSGAGVGGVVIAAGGLGANGQFGSSYQSPILYPGDLQYSNQEGGRTIKCTKGQYWAQQGKGACDDLGRVRFRLQDGTEVTNTSNHITRGYKAGYNIMQTAGKGKSSALAADGGNGARGGEGGWDANGGGGGGSGYQDGSVTVIDTRQGGSTGDAKVVLRVIDRTYQTVTWTATKESGPINWIKFTLSSGQGPAEFEFIESNTVELSIATGSIYTITSNATLRTNGTQRLDLEDFSKNDVFNNFDDLVITCDVGKFISNNTWTL